MVCRYSPTRIRLLLRCLASCLAAVLFGLGSPHAFGLPKLGALLDWNPPALARHPEDPDPPLIPERRAIGLDRYVYQNSAGDFLDQIKPLLPNLRYARWIRYPVPIVVRGESHEWITLVTQGIREWSRYIPLAVVHRPQQAGIEIIQSQDLQGISGSATPEFFWGEDGSLQQRVQILISAASMAEVPTITRHELGHALGLWGHSPDSSDLMYGGLHAQATGGKRILKVAQIGPRELNTLKRIYEQPTLIGERL